MGHRASDGYNFSDVAYAASAAAAISEDIPLSRDIVHLYLGGSAVIPSELDFKELYDNCTLAWITINGRSGMQFTSNINGNTLFFPASGRYEGATNERLNLNGDYMSRTYISATSCKFMDFYSEDAYPQASSRRYFGYTVRPIKPISPNRSIAPQTSVSEPTDEETPTEEEPKDENQR